MLVIMPSTGFSGNIFIDKDHENNFKLLHINNSSQNEDKLNSDWLSNYL